MRGRKNSHIYLFFIMTFLWAIIGLRDTSVGADTLGYTEDFHRFASMSFPEMWHYAFQTKEPLYVIISWLPSLVSDNYTSFLLVWALFPICSLYMVFKRELQDSVDYMIAILVFFLLGLFAFYVAGIRQTAALSIMLYASKYLRSLNYRSLRTIICNKSIYTFCIYTLIAYNIHNSSLLFICAIPCLFIKVRWWYIILVIVLFPLSKFVHLDQIVVLSKFFFEDRFANYGTVYESSQSISAMIMQVILFVLCFIARDKLQKKDSQNAFLFNMMFVGLIFQSLSGMLAEMARVSFYFSMFAMVLVPRALKEYSPNLKLLVYCCFVAFSLYYLFFLTGSNLPVYHSAL